MADPKKPNRMTRQLANQLVHLVTTGLFAEQAYDILEARRLSAFIATYYFGALDERQVKQTVASVINAPTNASLSESFGTVRPTRESDKAEPSPHG